MNKNSIVIETELLTDPRFYSFLTKADFGDKPPIVNSLMAGSLSEPAGLLKLVKPELEDVLSMPGEYLTIGISIGEAYSVWYALQNGLIAIGYSGYWQKISLDNIRVIRHANPAMLFEAIHKVNNTTDAAERRLSMSTKQKQRR
jgi:hypothetical protein